MDKILEKNHGDGTKHYTKKAVEVIADILWSQSLNLWFVKRGIVETPRKHWRKKEKNSSGIPILNGKNDVVLGVDQNPLAKKESEKSGDISEIWFCAQGSKWNIPLYGFLNTFEVIPAVTILIGACDPSWWLFLETQNPRRGQKKIAVLE